MKIAHLYLIAFLDLFAVSLLVPVIPTYLASLHADAVTIGMIKSMYGVLQLLTAPFAGSASDIYGRRETLMVSMVGAMVGYGIIGFGMHGSIFMVVLSRIPCGLFKHTLDIVKLAITDRESEETRSMAIGRLNACSSAGFILGPAIGGYTMKYYGFRWIAILTTFMFMVNFVIVFRIQNDERSSGRRRRMSLPKWSTPDWNHNFKHAKKWLEMIPSRIKIYKNHMETKGPARSMLLIRCIMALSVMLCRSHFVLVLSKYYQAGPTQTGYVLSYMGLLSAVFSALVGQLVKWVPSEEQIVLIATILLSLSYVALAMAHNLTMIYVAMIPNSLAISIMRACTISLQSKFVDRAHLGGFLGMTSSLSSIAKTIAPLIAGYLLSYHHTLPMYSAALVSSISGVLFFKNVYHEKHSHKYSKRLY